MLYDQVYPEGDLKLVRVKGDDSCDNDDYHEETPGD